MIEPLTIISSLTAAKEVYDTGETLQKICNVSKEMKTIAESEGKGHITATKDIAGAADNLADDNMLERAETRNKDLDVKGELHVGSQLENPTLKEDFIEKIDPTITGSEQINQPIEFVDKLCSEDNSKDVRNTQDVFVDKLSPNESIGKEQMMEGDISEDIKFGTYDFPRNIKTINDSLEGQKHPDTGVRYERKVVETDTGEIVEGDFPQFDSEYDAHLPEELEKASDKKQFDECNRQLKEKFDSDPAFKSKFTLEQQADIDEGRTPEGYTWHHNEEKRKMQLVDSDTHWNTRHTGGRCIWGGGSDNRK